MKTYPQRALPLLRRLVAVIAVCAAILLPVSSSAAAPGVFMKLDGVETWSELIGASSNVKAPTPNEPVVVPGLQISKRPDKTSPLLLQACGAGTVIKRVTLAWRDAGGTVYRITLEDVLVSSFTMATDGATPPQPREDCAFRFGKVEWSWFGTDGAENNVGGIGTRFDVPAQQATEKTYQPFRAALERMAGQEPSLRLTCPVESGRTYRISGSSALNGDWTTLEDFTAAADGEVERHLTGGAGRLFLRIEALD
jgi:type VI protein secretion system component Hcp